MPLVAITSFLRSEYAHKCHIKALVLCYGEPAELLSFPTCQWLVDVPAGEPDSATLFTRNVQCRTAKIDKFANAGTRFFWGKRSPGSYSGRDNTSKKALPAFFPPIFRFDNF